MNDFSLSWLAVSLFLQTAPLLLILAKELPLLLCEQESQKHYAPVSEGFDCWFSSLSLPFTLWMFTEKHSLFRYLLSRFSRPDMMPGSGDRPGEEGKDTVPAHGIYSVKETPTCSRDLAGSGQICQPKGATTCGKRTLCFGKGIVWIFMRNQA